MNTLKKKKFNSILDHLIIITSFDRFNSFKLFMSNYEYKVKAYCIENEMIKLSKKNIFNPCFFVLDQDSKIKHVFIHNKHDELLTELYLKNIMNLEVF